jgi:hypothetical protein
MKAKYLIYSMKEQEKVLSFWKGNKFFGGYKKQEIRTLTYA